MKKYTAGLQIPVTKEEKEIIKKLAHRFEIPYSEYLRRIIFASQDFNNLLKEKKEIPKEI